MDFITSLSRTSRQVHDSSMVVVDRLTKVAHFIPVKHTHSTSEVAQVFTREIVRLHGIPRKIVSNRDAKLTSRFWKDLFVDVGIYRVSSLDQEPKVTSQK